MMAGGSFWANAMYNKVDGISVSMATMTVNFERHSATTLLEIATLKQGMTEIKRNQETMATTVSGLHDRIIKLEVKP